MPYDFGFKPSLTPPDAARRYIAMGVAQAFGYVSGELVFGTNHTKITTALVLKGWDYNELMSAPQVWGWINRNAEYFTMPENGITIRFISDAKAYDNYENQSLNEHATNVIMDWWRQGLPQQIHGSRKWW